MSSWKLPSVLTWPALAVWEKIASVNFVIIWKESVQLRAQCHARLCFMNEMNWSSCSHWKPHRQLGLVQPGWTIPFLLINMHIMLLLRGFLHGFCTHFDWQKQWEIMLLSSRVIYQQLNFWSDRNQTGASFYQPERRACFTPWPYTAGFVTQYWDGYRLLSG